MKQANLTPDEVVQVEQIKERVLTPEEIAEKDK